MNDEYKVAQIKKLVIIAFAVIISIAASSQTIPLNRRVIWKGAGIFSNNPVISNELNILDFGGKADSTADNTNAIDSAMNSLKGHAGVIYFPPGFYYIRSTLNIPDSVTLRGNCHDSSWLVFNLGGAALDCIDAQNTNETGVFQSIIHGFSTDTNVITVDSINGFTVGGYAEIEETNGAWDVVPANWALNCVGQIVHITAIKGKNITFENPLRFTYNPSLKPVIRPWIPRTFVGFEDLEITRVDTGLPSMGYCINFTNALNCWVKGVESRHSVGAHVVMSTASNITVSGCYFHGSYAYDGVGTRGYGILMIQHAGQNLVENNVFDTLRHSIINKQGANGNVAGYNYAINEYRVENPDNAGADLLLHGHYPFANLYEGNIANNVMVDSTWGPAGPFNTFFRNRAALFGFTMTPGASVPSDSENFVGNETTDNSFLYGLFYFAGANQFLYGNDSLGNIIPKNTSKLPDTSYYRTSFADFWNKNPLPPTIGTPNVNGSGTIPARDRYISGGRITVSPFPQCNPITTIPKIDYSNGFLAYPNPATQFVNIKINSTNSISNIQFFAIDGLLVGQYAIPSGTNQMRINIQSYPDGLYFLKVTSWQGTSVIKLVIER